LRREAAEELARHGAAHDVVGKRVEQVAHVNDSSSAGCQQLITDLCDGQADLVDPRMLKGPDLVGGEQVRGDELPALQPLLPVGHEGHVGGATEEDGRDGQRRPGSEGVVVRPQDLPRRPRRRHDEVSDGAEAEKHEAAAVLGGEVAEGDVGLLLVVADEVQQVADDGETTRGRRGQRQLLVVLTASSALLFAFAATDGRRRPQQEEGY
jgi:hypothetical protein